jgi:transcriptional regulator with XRE-family HTH domain
VITGNIGKRLKTARVDRGLTLKAVEAACGVSATHISEIERGAASPTVGALEKIARALGRRAGYFLEADEIGEFSLVTRDDRVRETAASGGVVERLTTGIPGGRLQVVQVTISPGSVYRADRHAHDGVEALVVRSGRVRVTVGRDAYELDAGDAVQFDASRPHAYSNASASDLAILLWVATRRDVS